MPDTCHCATARLAAPSLRALAALMQLPPTLFASRRTKLPGHASSPPHFHPHSRLHSWPRAISPATFFRGPHSTGNQVRELCTPARCDAVRGRAGRRPPCDPVAESPSEGATWTTPALPGRHRGCPSLPEQAPPPATSPKGVARHARLLHSITRYRHGHRPWRWPCPSTQLSPWWPPAASCRGRLVRALASRFLMPDTTEAVAAHANPTLLLALSPSSRRSAPSPSHCRPCSALARLAEGYSWASIWTARLPRHQSRVFPR